jgi:hypothetical protein
MDNTRVFRMAFASVYPHYITKAERKGRTKDEVHAIIQWLTGYDEQTLQQQIEKKVDFETFFARAPRINPNVSKITGVICGHRVDEIGISSCNRSVTWTSWWMNWPGERRWTRS